jgi:hypothetical protein
MLMAIPSRVEQVEDKQKRFYVFVPSSVYLELQKESIRRGTDLWTLCGSVLTEWVQAGSPDRFPQPPES